MSPTIEKSHEACHCHLTLAIATVPIQPFIKPYDPPEALKHGTIFSNLYYPFFIGGEDDAR